MSLSSSFCLQIKALTKQFIVPGSAGADLFSIRFSIKRFSLLFLRLERETKHKNEFYGYLRQICSLLSRAFFLLDVFFEALQRLINGSDEKINR